MSNFYKIGDVVVTNGDKEVPMTVAELLPLGESVRCFWFTEGGILHKALFPEDTLTLIPEDEV